MDDQREFPSENHPPPRRRPPSGSWTESGGGTFLRSCAVAGCATLLAPLALLAGFVVLAVVLVKPAMEGASGGFPGLPGADVFEERLIRAGGENQKTIAVISLIGAIDGSGSGLDGTGQLRVIGGQLNRAADDDEVEGVLLQINSPGGGLTASDLLHREVRKLRDKGKHVIVWAGDIMASGGLYVAAAGEGIVASPTAMVGSIGVIMERFQVDGLLRLVGVKADPIMAGKHKDIGSPFRELSPEERALFQKNLDHFHRRFIRIAAEGRGLSEEAVAELADGRIFTAEDARANGLVDRIGYAEEAVEWLEELCGGSDMRIVSYRRRPGLWGVLEELNESLANALRFASSPDAPPRAAAVWRGK